MMHENSLETYFKVVEGLSQARLKVLQQIKEHPGATRQELAEWWLDWKINKVTGRVKELLDMGLVYEEGTKYVHGHPRAKVWPVPPEGFVKQPKRKTLREKLRLCKDDYAKLEAKYMDLLYQVAEKFPDESRHETAKRLILRAQESGHNEALSKENSDGT